MKLEAIKSMASMSPGLDVPDRATLNDILPDLVARTETPTTQLSIQRIKMIGEKAGPVFWDGAKKVLMDVVSEAVKRSLFPHG